MKTFEDFKEKYKDTLYLKDTLDILDGQEIEKIYFVNSGEIDLFTVYTSDRIIYSRLKNINSVYFTIVNREALDETSKDIINKQIKWRKYYKRLYIEQLAANAANAKLRMINDVVILGIFLLIGVLALLTR